MGGGPQSKLTVAECDLTQSWLLASSSKCFVFDLIFNCEIQLKLYIIALHFSSPKPNL